MKKCIVIGISLCLYMLSLHAADIARAPQYVDMRLIQKLAITKHCIGKVGIECWYLRACQDGSRVTPYTIIHKCTREDTSELSRAVFALASTQGNAHTMSDEQLHVDIVSWPKKAQKPLAQATHVLMTMRIYDALTAQALFDLIRM